MDGRGFRGKWSHVPLVVCSQLHRKEVHRCGFGVKYMGENGALPVMRLEGSNLQLGIVLELLEFHTISHGSQTPRNLTKKVVRGTWDTLITQGALQNMDWVSYRTEFNQDDICPSSL